MVKKLVINCNFKTTSAPITFYVGSPSDEYNPIYFQSKWLAEKKEGTVPQEIIDSFIELQKVATKNRVAFEDLCAFVIEELKENISSASERKRIDRNKIQTIKQLENENNTIVNNNDNNEE